MFPQVPEMFRAITRDGEKAPVDENTKFCVIVPFRHWSSIQRRPIWSVLRKAGEKENDKQQQPENHSRNRYVEPQLAE